MSEYIQPVAQIFVNAMALAAASRLFPIEKGKRDTREKERSKLANSIAGPLADAIAVHLTTVVNWATETQFFGMSAPQKTDKSTIALAINAQARRFQGVEDTKIATDEKGLMSDANSILLLGEPGSGKTTTLKRMALNMLTEEPSAKGDIFQFPIVVRLKDLNKEESLYTRLADEFGLSTTLQLNSLNQPETADINEGIHLISDSHKIRVSKEKLKNVLGECLNKGCVLLLLDGLDELNSNRKETIREEIVNLRLCLTNAKIIVSCRSGDYSKQMEGFSVLEICPLTKEQIKRIAEIWLDTESDTFIKLLYELPYADIAHRPLLLTQLLFLYRRWHYFPEQPCKIYKKMVNLLLEEWDDQRNIRRISKYAGFEPDVKADFLAALAYHLTYSLEKKRFSEDDLVRAYLAIHNRFRLPKNEATEVAREIQTHTGIIIFGQNDQYEFCHLSLQEYLCASHIVGLPSDMLSAQTLSKYSAPLAVAVALSSNPSQWLGSLILKYGNRKYFDEAGIASFISRVMIERPNFEVSEPIGFAILSLYDRYINSPKVCSDITHLLEMDIFRQSLATALKWYTPRKSQLNSADYVLVEKKKNLEEVYHNINIPVTGAFPNAIVSDLTRINGGKLFLG